MYFLTKKVLRSNVDKSSKTLNKPSNAVEYIESNIQNIDSRSNVDYVPHGRKHTNTQLRYRPPIPNQGPLYPWALHMPTHMPRGAPHGRLTCHFRASLNTKMMVKQNL